jgi:CDP-glucose 4,6-dehydratase
VTGYALAPPTQPSLFEVARVGTGMRSVIADIRDLDALAQSLIDSAPDIVIHMAAQALVRRSYVSPVETYAVNVMGTAHLLEAVRAVDSVRSVVVVTSDKCYENREWPWGYREIDPMGGHDPYSSSKGCAELVTAAYRDSFLAERGVAVASVRAGNVIGGGDWAEDRLVPDILRAIERGHPVNIRSPHAVRPWQHVLEPLSGYLQLAQKLYTDGGEYAEGWNFGPVDEDARPVQYIVERLTGFWGEGATWQLDGNPHPREAHYLKLDCSKARVRLGWQPKWDLTRTLQTIIDWHKAYGQNRPMREVSLGQISEYQIDKGDSQCKQ